MSNIKLLWEKANETYNFELEYFVKKTIDNLLTITSSALFIKVRILRNKRFAHSDFNDMNKPFKIEGFSKEEIEVFSQQLNVGIEILNIINKKTNNNTVLFPHKDILLSPTKTFIDEIYFFISFYKNNKT